MKIVYSPQAVEALKSIYAYWQQESPKAAPILHNDILDGIDRLSSFPEMASVEPLLENEPETFRSLVIKHRYKAVYVIENDAVNIVDIWDCRQDPEMLKKKAKKK